jgi:hypothetical protein
LFVANVVVIVFKVAVAGCVGCRVDVDIVCVIVGIALVDGSSDR